MIQIKFTKVPPQALTVLQDMLLQYAEGFKEHLAKKEETTVFYYAVNQVNLATRMWYSMRPKVEQFKDFSFSLKAAEATVMFNACNHVLEYSRDEYEIFVARKYRDLIDEQLKSFVTVVISEAPNWVQTIK